MQVMHPIKVVDGKGADKMPDGNKDELEVIAGLYGASEVIR
jgi:hypothetical protein